MREVKGYPLEIIDVQSFEVPASSDLLSVSLAERPVLWVRQDEDDKPTSPRRMVTIYSIPSADGPTKESKRNLLPNGSRFLGTVTPPSGVITMHFFEGAA